MQKPEYRADIFPHWTPMKVRFRDLDPLNHVNNAIFSTYYEEARIHFIQQIPRLRDFIGNGYSYVLADIHINFIRPATFPADLLVGSGITSTGNTSIQSFQAIYLEDSKQLVSVAEASGVWFNTEKQRPSKLPDATVFDAFKTDINN